MQASINRQPERSLTAQFVRNAKTPGKYFDGNGLYLRVEANGARAVMTFEQVARKVHEMHAPTWKKPKHAAQFIATLETYAFPHMGKLKVPDVITADVLASLSPIWVKKPETARRVRQRIGTVLNGRSQRAGAKTIQQRA